MSNNLKYLKEDFYNSVYFENKFKDNIKIIDVKGTEKLSEIFLKKLNNLLSTNYTIGEIENLHRNIDEDYKIYDQIFAINKISTFFYDMPDSFIQEYFKILKLKVRSVIGEDFYFQKNPTLRLQMPHKTAEPMYPFYHSDIQLGHPPYEINLWIPLNHPSLNEGYGFSISSLKDSIEIFEKYNFDVDKMSKDGRKDIPNLLDPISKLQNFEYGQAVLFDTRCLHSGKIMSDHTRVSIDVRITPVKLFKKFNHEYQGTGRKKTIFKPGGGYNINSIDNIEL